MAALTKEERAAKRAAEEATRNAALVEKRKAALAVNPLRILKLMARAEAGHYCSAVTVRDGSVDPTDETSPSMLVTFTFYPDNVNDDDHEETLNVFSETWEVEAVELIMDNKDAKRAAELQRLELARATYDSLSPEQRAALFLVRRP